MNLALDFGEMKQTVESALVPASPSQPTPVQALASRFEENMQEHGSPVRAVRHQPARPAQFAPFPATIDGRIQSAMAARGIEQLYTHQASAIHKALSGKNVVVVTP